ncbi:TPA: hypothetical protein OT180_003577 [Morganella morganii]|nr:hypothetical protein [Morganella morganii]
MYKKIEIEFKLIDEAKNILTIKEIEVLTYILQVLSVSEISKLRWRSIKTILAQKRSAYEKLDIKADALLTKKLFERNLVKIYKKHN